ncbi:hypothetical protein PDIG_72210 [Penicillium digitatum PHI26]|uniref:Uncharacterized protein n=2 Tax=Penicillium digitatum TaxID=36651 RepID=K9FY19_PEND2|nr:hypothetical protein PDIP_81480 [Penicillium digitatum Pd1]EKV05752.1 hypothetical protein PDIP_81480 [Penicillium digitatum Pd1]EKV07608.1 hypothetical protein PDIG_72210 [Penicillium digitatum PHI26]
MGSKKDQPDAGLRSLNHCMQEASFLIHPWLIGMSANRYAFAT